MGGREGAVGGWGVCLLVAKRVTVQTCVKEARPSWMVSNPAQVKLPRQLFSQSGVTTRGGGVKDG